MKPRIGSLFSGYGGLDMAVHAALGGGEVVWHSDIKPASIALLKHRHPDVPNIGNVKFAHWPRILRAYGPIDVLAASWPCQPHSSAGKRLGEVDPRALWPNVAHAISETRPAFFFGENVARITSNGELRRVVRSLADLGYVGAWRVLNASDIGAPHKRSRCFVVAVRGDLAPDALGQLVRDEPGRGGGQGGTGRGVAGHDGATGPAGLTLLPPPTQNMTTGAGRQGRAGGMNLQTAAVTLLPTPARRDVKGPSARGPRIDGYARSDAQTQLPNIALRHGENGGHWGIYAAAVERWEHVLGRAAPDPTIPSPRSGGPQLSPWFVEWMMGLPAGWVCDVPDLAPRPAGHRNAALSLLGDGVVPQQGAAAFSFLLDHLARRLAVAA